MKILIIHSNQKNHLLDKLTSTKSRMEWFTFYAMDWISQINFFNHYIHKQIILVTGSTGTGKLPVPNY